MKKPEIDVLSEIKQMKERAEEIAREEIEKES